VTVLVASILLQSLCCSLLQSHTLLTKVCCSLCVAVCCSLTHYNTLHHTAAYCTTLQRIHTLCQCIHMRHAMLQFPCCNLTHCITLHNIVAAAYAAHCNIPQHIATKNISSVDIYICVVVLWQSHMLQHTATHCSILKHTATNI